MQKILQAIFLIFIFISSATAGDVVNLTVGKHQAELLSLPSAMHRVIIADRSVAGVVKHSGNKVSIIGHGLGRTDIRFMNKNRRIIRQVNVYVTHNLPEIRRSLKNFFPDENIGVELVNESVALTGLVTDAKTASRAVQIVEEFIKKEGGIIDQGNEVLNLMSLRSAQQVMLRVRVGELQREALKTFGHGAAGIIKAGSSAALGIFDDNGDSVFKVLAEPTLTAISGEEAEFLAGGEFPIPVAQNNGATSIVYKPFGVSVKYTPTVLSENRIRLQVESEVSDISDVASISTAAMKVPSITTRRSQTTVELGSGESFMIAGLIKDNHSTKISEVPGLGNIPVLSALFRSSSFQRNESELVIAVTPYFVDPVESSRIKLPTDDFHTPGTLEMMFYGALGSMEHRSKAARASLEGPVGFMLD